MLKLCIICTTVIVAVGLAFAAAPTKCVTRSELRTSLRQAGYEVTKRGGKENQRTWRIQAYQIVLEQFKDYRVCDADIQRIRS